MPEAQQDQSTDLISIESIHALELFTNDENVDELLQRIKKQVEDFQPDLETATGRREIASMAHKVARSKVVLDTAGKDLVADWKAKAAVVDASRRKVRDYLDNLKAEVRAPLTEWEEEQERLKQERIAAQKLSQDHDQALQMHEIWKREKAIEEHEAQIAEAERKALAQEALRIEAAERDRRIRAEADEKARRQREELERQKIEAEEREAQAKRDLEAAEERRRLAEEQAERDRLQAIADAKEQERRYEERQKQAIEEERERIRIQREKEDREARELKILRERQEKELREVESHKETVRKEAVEDLRVAWDEGTFDYIVDQIENGNIRHVKLIF